MNETAICVLLIILIILVIVCIGFIGDVSLRLSKVEERNNHYKDAATTSINDLLKYVNLLDDRTATTVLDVWKIWRYGMNNKESKPSFPKFEKTADMDDPQVPKEVQDKERAKDLSGIIELTKCTNPNCKCTKVPLFKEMYDK